MTLEQLEEKLKGREPGLMDASGQYAVLVPLVEREGKLHILYEVRSQDMRRQPGEVCFPGGRIEGDETPEACAIRETEEELGIPAEAMISLHIDEVTLYDKDGQDVTEQYKDPSVTASWGGGKGTAERFLLYVYMGIVVLLAVGLVRYFLRRD